MKRVLQIEVEAGHVAAYTHHVNEHGMRSLVSFGLQGEDCTELRAAVRDLLDMTLDNTLSEPTAFVRKEVPE